MNLKNYSRKFVIFAIFLLFSALNASAQMMNFPAPREEKLLNGLRLLAWNDPKAEKVTVKLRIHSGAAFDLQGREGTFGLLTDIIFPTRDARLFFIEDLNGGYAFYTTYDYIQFDLTGDNDKFLELLEVLAAAIQNPPIDKDNTAAVKKVILDLMGQGDSPGYIAEKTVRKRLLGTFPYGRPMSGTVESVQKIDFADILLAKQKYLTSDNATLAVSGNVKPELVFRAAKRYFGGWLKADKKIPSTFTAPNAPDTKTFLTKTDIENTSELRYAFRGLARNDKDFAASEVLTRILQNRLKPNGTIRHEAHILPGIVIFELPNWNVGTIKIDGDKISLPGNTFTFVADLLKKNVEQAEFDQAKADFLSEFGKQNTIDFWLDNHTFKLLPIKDETQKATGVTLADTQRVLENWRKEPVTTSLVVTAPK